MLTITVVTVDLVWITLTATRVSVQRVLLEIIANLVSDKKNEMIMNGVK